ncbi:T9SS type A sorting domain-containing protein [Flavobacterium caeni]|uniref:Por secretion system C-terminal sorting domain-containing protein n=1 Tax=Flavobacterium caeni TaxID=490189 RepID=A0A1G5JPD9_9FLAO|nr:T9SS type A sorting domain-containing protein [Flavobacterium caeni]SCY90216.1 Por secretion system C-terminal sorting domain-containing protein [Flavobacterium caeni]
MKRFLKTTVCFLALGFACHAQTVSIPDPVFKAKLVASDATNNIAFDFLYNAIVVDTNHDGEIQVSEAAQVYILDVGHDLPTSVYIESLAGISAFTNLRMLMFNNNHITDFDITGLVNLTLLDCSQNLLESLNLPNLPLLENLYCSKNQLTVLGLSAFPTLKNLGCDNNQLTSLDISQLPLLNSCYCSNNQITHIQLSGSPALGYLSCDNNQLTSLDINGMPGAGQVSCSGNNITALSASNLPYLSSLDCSNNNLTSLSLTNLNYFSGLYCGSNQLQSLNLAGLPVLNVLGCSFNQFTSLDFSDFPTLYSLDCSYNQLTSLELNYNYNLNELFANNNQLTSLGIKNGRIETYINLAANPNLGYVCADSGQVGMLQTVVSFYGYNNCLVDSACEVLGTEKFEPAGMAVYPNPVYSSLHIKSPYAIDTITIYNMGGQRVMDLVNPTQAIDVEALPSGTYFLSAVSGGNLMHQKFVKQ